MQVRLQSVLVFLLFMGLLSGHARVVQEDLQEEVTVTVKLVQIFVTDKEGDPITDLDRTDFELYDNGKAVKITEFERHILSAPGGMPEKEMPKKRLAEKLVPPPHMTRKFLLFFDFAFNEKQGIPKAKKAALHFIDAQVHPEDEIGIMTYDVFKGLTLHEYFTAEHEKVREVIANFGIKNAGGRAEDFTQDEWSEFRSVNQGQGSGASADSAYRISDAVEGEIYKFQVRNFAKKMGDLAKALRYVPGAKHIVLFSGGVANAVLYGEHLPKTPVGRQSSISPSPLNTGDAVLRDIYEAMCRELAASNSLVYPVNTAGKSVSHFRERDEMGDFSLRRMAQLSGGNYYDNISGYEDVTEKIQSLTGSFYVLGYYIDEKWDGKYHKIKVKVKRKGYRVFGQQGYFNPKPFSEYTKMERMIHLIDLALSDNPLLQEPLRFPLTALPFAQDQKVGCVAVTRIPAEKIKNILGTKMEIVTLFFDEDENIAGMQKSQIGYSKLAEDNVYFYSFTSLDPGNYDCRIVIRNLELGQGAVAASQVSIPEMPDRGLILYPPLLLAENGNAAGYVNGTKEKQSEKEIFLTDIYSFDSSQVAPLVGDLDGSVTTMQVAVKCSIFAIDNPELKLCAHLKHPPSDEKMPLEFSILEQSGKKDNWSWLIEFPVAGLETGTYTLHLSAEERNTKSQSYVSAGFSIK